MKESRWRDDPDIVAIREGARLWRQEKGVCKFIGWRWDGSYRIALYGSAFE